MKRRIYLDNNASTAVDSQVIQTIHDFLPKLQGNPSSIHEFGREARSIINAARDVLSQYLKVKPSEIVFTSGGTESCLLAIDTILANRDSGHIISSTIEHSCVYQKVKELTSRGFTVTQLDPTSDGNVSVEAIVEHMSPKTKLVAIMSANNETGIKNDIKKLAEECHKRGIPLFVDAVASFGKENIEVYPGVSAMAFSGHKIHVPAGIGFLYIHRSLQKTILQQAHEGGLRPGTENILGIAALKCGIEQLQLNFQNRLDKMSDLKDYFEKQLLARYNISVNGGKNRISNVSNVCFHGVDGESLLIALDRQGIACSHGSACSSGAFEPSRVLRAMGLPLDHVKSSLRFSFCHNNTKEEIDTVLEVLSYLISASPK